MGYLSGLQEYLDRAYNISVFDQALASHQPWQMHTHNHCIIKVRILENLKYDLSVNIDGAGDEILPKTHVKLLYPEDLAGSVTPLVKTDKKVRDLALEPIFSPRNRYHIKNKSLFPLMEEKTVVFFTLLEGETIRGIVAGFSRYEITVNLKGGIPVTILRHSIYDLRDKKGRCFMKSFQETHRDWEKSPLFVSSPPET
jgi:ribosomal protein S1